MMRKMLKKVYIVGLALGIAFWSIAPLVFSPTPAQAVQQEENDDLFDVEAYNGVREDEIQVLPLGDFFPAFDFSFDFSFDVDLDQGSFPFGNASNDVSTDIQSILDPLFTAEDQFQKDSSEQQLPRASVNISSAGIQPGAQVTASAQAQNYQHGGSFDELFYAWALDNVSLSGVAAGADPLDLPQAQSPRGVHSRTPQTDADGDGMDDDWEIRYGLDPTNPADAGQDLDQDGYTNDVYANEDGDVLIVEPETTAGPAGGPLTNLKEYIWGTDPTNPDTDGDGFNDGQDIAGLGQMQISLVVPPDAAVNDAPELRVTILGNSLIEFDAETPLVKLDSTTQALNVTDAERLDVRIDSDNDAPVPGETVHLKAVLGRTDYQPGILSYTWFVNSVAQTEGSGESAFVFDYAIPATATPGEIIAIGVTAVNFETRQQADAELEIRVGELMQLHYDPDQVEVGKDVTVSASLVNQSDPAELVFHWTLDDAELIDESGQGKTAVTITVPPGTGEQHDVALRVTTPEDSELFAEQTTTLSTHVPSVELIAEPSQIGLGQSVTAIAVPEHFTTEPIQYRWTLDDEVLTADPFSSVVEIVGESAGTHTVEVTARTTGTGAESASAESTFTVSEELQTTISSLNRSGPTLASVRQAVFGRPIRMGIVVAIFFAVLGIVTALLIRRNALS